MGLTASDLPRVNELMRQFDVADAHELKHALEDWEHWSRFIGVQSAAVEHVRRELRLVVGTHIDGDVAVNVARLREWVDSLYAPDRAIAAGLPAAGRGNVAGCACEAHPAPETIITLSKGSPCPSINAQTS